MDPALWANEGRRCSLSAAARALGLGQQLSADPPGRGGLASAGNFWKRTKH